MCQPLWQTVSQRADTFLSPSLRPASSVRERNWLHEIRSCNKTFPKVLPVNVHECWRLCRLHLKHTLPLPEKGEKYQTREVAGLFFMLWNPVLVVIQPALASDKELWWEGPDVAAFALGLEEQPCPVLNFWVYWCFRGGFGLGDW